MKLYSSKKSLTELIEVYLDSERNIFNLFV